MGLLTQSRTTLDDTIALDRPTSCAALLPLAQTMRTGYIQHLLVLVEETRFVIPAKAGIHCFGAAPPFAGVTLPVWAFRKSGLARLLMLKTREAIWQKS